MKLFEGRRPTNLGVLEGRLAPVADRPNSVSSQAQSAGHAIAPIVYRLNALDAMARLVHGLREMPRVTIIEATPYYVYAEFGSRWLGFVDDVEFWFTPEQSTIQVRSASRLGYRDFGVNRRRIELIRTWF